MDGVQESPLHIQDIVAFSTRRTSRQDFENSINGMIAAVQNFIINGDPLILADFERNAEDARYAFNTLCQKMFGSGSDEGGSDEAAVGGSSSRSNEAAVGGSSSRSNEAAVGGASSGSDEAAVGGSSSESDAIEAAVENYAVVDRRFFRVPRDLTLAELHAYLRLQFHVEDPYGQLALTELHTELRGMRYGPLLNNNEWVQVVNNPENLYRINILFVHNH